MTSRTEITIQPDGSATSSSSKTTLIMHPDGGRTNQVVTTSANMSSSFASSASTQTAKTVSGTSSTTSTRTVKQSSSKTVKTSSTKVMSSTVKSSSSRAISIKSNTSSFSDTFGKELGIDVDAEMQKLRISADQEMRSIKEKYFNLQPLALAGTGSDIIKIDDKSINNYIDKAHDDRLKFNFDVTEFESETITVKSDGNKIEVHAKKRSKKGDDESSEEYSRVYELPTAGALDADKVTSSFYKDGILTVEIPIQEAIKST